MWLHGVLVKVITKITNINKIITTFLSTISSLSRPSWMTSTDILNFGSCGFGTQKTDIDFPSTLFKVMILALNTTLFLPFTELKIRHSQELNNSMLRKQCCGKYVIKLAIYQSPLNISFQISKHPIGRSCLLLFTTMYDVNVSVDQLSGFLLTSYF
jgi:hypothetical protein